MVRKPKKFKRKKFFALVILLKTVILSTYSNERQKIKQWPGIEGRGKKIKL